MRTRVGKKIFARKMSPTVLGSIGYIGLRTRFIDDYLQTCIDNGLEQLVILGAGYDSRAYRFPELQNGMKIFEVDKPETQEDKVHRLKKVFKSIPSHVTFVPVDFAEEKLEDKLPQNGYDSNLTTLFIWEGVTPYLEPYAVDKTLAFVANRSKWGSSIVFDYAPANILVGTNPDPKTAEWVMLLAKIGEPHKFGIDPATIDRFLGKRGFSQVKDYSVEECKRITSPSMRPRR